MERSRKKQIIKDLNKKMVFLVGPRQVGKTWLAKEIAKEFPTSIVLNYDQKGDHEIIDEQSWGTKVELIVFDEIHKMPQWKNFLKGVYDGKEPHQKILVTGSARLDVFRKAGDSLVGRFFSHRLLPFTLAELKETKWKSDIERLLSRGGFPEPFLAQEESEAARWRMQYLDGLIRQDVLSLQNIHDFKTMTLLVELLRDRVGSPLSSASLAEDLQVSPHTVKKYILLLENLYILYRVTPYSKNVARSILKEPKIYFYDHALVRGSEGARLENLLANALQKHCFEKEDLLGRTSSLHYLRNRDGKEVDFCVITEGEPPILVESKTSKEEVSPFLIAMRQNIGGKGIQAVKDLRKEHKKNHIEIRKLSDFLQEL